MDKFNELYESVIEEGKLLNAKAVKVGKEYKLTTPEENWSGICKAVSIDSDEIEWEIVKILKDDPDVELEVGEVFYDNVKQHYHEIERK